MSHCPALQLSYSSPLFWPQQSITRNSSAILLFPIFVWTPEIKDPCHPLNKWSWSSRLWPLKNWGEIDKARNSDLSLSTFLLFCPWLPKLCQKNTTGNLEMVTYASKPLCVSKLSWIHSFPVSDISPFAHLSPFLGKAPGIMPAIPS